MEKSPERPTSKSSPAVAQFMAKWEQAFERIKRKTYNPDAWWQGFKAYEELRKAPGAEVVMFPSKHRIGDDHFRAVVREIESYKQHVHDLQGTTIDYEEVACTLTNYERRFKQKRSSDKNLKEIWQRCAAFMRYQRVLAHRLLRRRWTRALQSPTRVDWVRSDLTSHESTLYPHWDAIFSTAKYPHRSSRITELDARLQIRLGTIFRFWFPYVERTHNQ